jgi:large subunit ribosomal protein L18
MAGVKKIKSVKVEARQRRKVSIRKKLSGTPERPRLSVFRSARYIYIQAVDDTSNKVLATASDLEKDLKAELKGKKKKERAEAVGKVLAKRLLAKDVKSAVFDRNGFIYHGRISAIAKGARDAGLKF